MWSERLQVEAEVLTLSPLHVGTGRTAVMSLPRGTDDSAPEFATTMTDHMGFPCIPGSTLKGALLAASGGHDMEGLKDRIFGGVAETSGKQVFHAGAVTFFTALLKPSSVNAHEARGREPMPAVQQVGKPVAMATHGMEIAARTAIDGGMGVADDHKLFSEQVVAPGARFGLRLRFGGSLGLEEELRALGILLSPLLSEDGMPLGAGATYGRGRLRLEPSTLRATKITPDGQEDVSQKLRMFLLPPSDSVSRTLRLTCHGPFVVMDAAASVGRRKGAPEVGHADPHVEPLEDTSGRPLLPGESLHGVLRREATWIARLENAGYEDHRFTPLPKGEPTEWTDRLFGRAGWRGFLHIVSVTCESPGTPETFSSIRLDRFSGAPIDGGLFFTRAHVNPIFVARLALVDHGGSITPEDEKRFSELITHIESNGIEIGHAASKGFGWFTVEEV